MTEGCFIPPSYVTEGWSRGHFGRSQFAVVMPDFRRMPTLLVAVSEALTD